MSPEALTRLTLGKTKHVFSACLAQSARQHASVILAMPQAKRFVDLAPSQILFTHDSIAETFSCGRYIDHTYEELLQGDIQVEDLPMIKVKRADLSTHQYWAARGWDFDLFWAVTGNRRTWVYRKLQVAGLCNSVRCELSKKGVGSERFTTPNCGDSVVVRYKRGHARQLQSSIAPCSSLWCKECLLESAECSRGFCSSCCPAYSSKYCSIHDGIMCKARCGSRSECGHGFCSDCCPAYSAKYCSLHYGQFCTAQLCKECLLESAECSRGFCSNCCPAYSSKYCSIHHGMRCKAGCGSRSECGRGFCSDCCPAYSAKYCRLHVSLGVNVATWQESSAQPMIFCQVLPPCTMVQWIVT